MSNYPEIDRSKVVVLLDEAANQKPGYFDEEEIVFTNEQVQDFLVGLKSYNEPGTIKVATEFALFVENAQVRKGDQRVELCVVDLGDIRAMVAY